MRCTMRELFLRKNPWKPLNGIIVISFAVVCGVILAGIAVCIGLYYAVQKSFFEATFSHETAIIQATEALGSEMLDSKIRLLKHEIKNTAAHYERLLAEEPGGKREKFLSHLDVPKNGLGYCYRTRDALYCGKQAPGEEYIQRLDLKKVWQSGEVTLFDPDFDGRGNYIMALAAPVRINREMDGILVELLDGYCLSQWLEEAFVPLKTGTAYIVNKEGRHIATAKKENYDWIISRYNATELAKTVGDEESKSIAFLEQRALQGETATGSYLWNGGSSYIAFGPLHETGWGFYTGFYGDAYGKYTKQVAAVGSQIGGLILFAFLLFLGGAIILVLYSLDKERKYSQRLMHQKKEIESQAQRIAASEERFRVAMRRSRDIILEYRLEDGEITWFYPDEAVTSGQIDEPGLQEKLARDGRLEPSSFDRFKAALMSISKGMLSTECLLRGQWRGEQKWYRMTVSAILDSVGKPARVVGILKDVTGEKAAELDSLTTLSNKASMTKAVEADMKKIGKHEKSAFVMLDLDHFKQVNDTHGHPAGDKVILMLARILKDVFPEPYLLGRFGGDEFCIYCPPGKYADSLADKLEQVRRRVREMRLEACANAEITCSCGAVVFYGQAEFEEVYKKADEMLYAAKAAGRDGCRFYCEEPNAT